MKVSVSPLKSKKYRATFDDGTHTDFGFAGMEDYTQTGDKKRRELYLARHRAREDWNNPKSAGSLSRWILWGDSKSINTNIREFKKKFSL
jgi:hypothetical protein